jgi:hypothetical protein
MKQNVENQFAFEVRMLRTLRLRRAAPLRQSFFPFVDRSTRRVRWFKRMIVAGTLLAIAALIAAAPRGRYLAGGLGVKSRQLFRWSMGGAPERAEIAAEWDRYRQQGVQDTEREFRRVFSEMAPSLQKLMRYAGNDPETGLLRWGNLTQTLLLPSKVFAAADTGRSYRLRPSVRSVWLRNIIIQKIPLTFFLVPEGPGLQEAMSGTSAVIVESTSQTTNSWGLRGPEPSPSALLRGIVLGDSYIQGLFVGDEETPSECLRRELQGHFKKSTSILNTGHLGYSPEQEFHTLVEYADLFHPHFVVLSLFANDFGGIEDVLQGGGDWSDSNYWIGEILQYCRSKGVICLVVPVPLERQVYARRFAGHYQGRISNFLETSGQDYVDPIEDFVNEHIKLLIEGERAHNRPANSPLYNGRIADGHFSAVGCQVWARAVARRLELLLEKARDAKVLTF